MGLGGLAGPQGVISGCALCTDEAERWSCVLIGQ